MLSNPLPATAPKPSLYDGNRTTGFNFNASTHDPGATIETSFNVTLPDGTLLVQVNNIGALLAKSDIDAGGALTANGGISTNGTVSASGDIASGRTLITGGFTVATLPTANLNVGARACVTDANVPAFMAPVIGGGSVICPVFYNGSAWVAG
jgi:hypothetical protein